MPSQKAELFTSLPSLSDSTEGGGVIVYHVCVCLRRQNSEMWLEKWAQRSEKNTERPVGRNYAIVLSMSIKAMRFIDYVEAV